MKLLVACEESATVRDEFARRGWDAYSCDLIPSRGASGSRRRHLVGDVRSFLYEGWDMMIAHPPCTYLSSSGLHWNSRGRGFERTEAALDFVARLMLAPIPMICIENPRGCISTKLRPADQWIQPYEFGEDASKETGLWLKNLPPLKLGRRVAGRVVEWPAGSSSGRPGRASSLSVGLTRRTVARTICRRPMIARYSGPSPTRGLLKPWPNSGPLTFCFTRKLNQAFF